MAFIEDPKASTGTPGQYAGVLPPAVGASQGASGSSGTLRAGKAGQTLFNSGTVAAGAAYDTGSLDTSMLENLTIVAVNSSAVTTRTVTITFLTEALVTLHTITRTLAVSATEKYAIGPAREAAGLVETLTIAAPLDVAPFMRVQIAAAGADAVAIRAWGH